MNIRIVALFLVALVFPGVVFAGCPTQRTTVVYVNGIDTTEREAGKSMSLLRDEMLKASGVSVGCVDFTYAYNTNEPIFLDLLEAGVQKTRELTLDMTDFWKQYFRVAPYIPAKWFGDLVDIWYTSHEVALNGASFLLGDQTDEHIAKYRDQLKQGRQVILVPHSQGNFYANEEWVRLTFQEQDQTHIVAVATPADKVADGGSYTTLTEDWIARYFFPIALAAETTNGDTCLDNWVCHSFDDSYMRGQSSRNEIVDNIIALLPTSIPPPPVTSTLSGIVWNLNGKVVPGAFVELYDTATWNLVVSTQTDMNGYYRLENLQSCNCYVSAGISAGYGDAMVTIPTKPTNVTQDIILSAVPM